MINLHEKIIEKVIKLSAKNVENNFGGPFAAIIVKNNKIIASGTNKVLKKHDPTCHAEIEAIRNASKKLKTFDLKGCTLYTSCYPCPMCFSAIYWANIKQVYYCATKEVANKYGFRDKKIYDELQNKIVSIKMEQIENKDCLVAFKLWKSSKKKIAY